MITPQEKRHRLRLKGENFLSSLQVVAAAHGENVGEIIGNMVSDGEPIYTGIINGATDVIFSQHDAKKALNMTVR